MTVDEALDLARLHGVEVRLNTAGNGLHLEARAEPPPRLLAILGCGKWDIVAVLRQREIETRRAIVRWINDNFTSSSASVCAHCRGGDRGDDPFVLLFVGSDRADVHSSCHSAWRAQMEAEARKALGLGARPAVTIAEPNELKDCFAMIPRRLRSGPADVVVPPVPRTREIHVEVGGCGICDTNDEEHREESLPRAAPLTIPSATEDDEQ